MKKRILLLAVFLLTTITNPTQAHANDAPTTILTQTPLTLVEDDRAKILHQYLTTYNSPLAPYAEKLILEADQNNLDWKILPAISGVESYFGQQIPSFSHNGWGFGIYGNNVRKFQTWEEGIKTVATSLRNDYMDKWKAKNIYEIGHFYAADPNWADKVNHYITEMDNFEKYQHNTTLKLAL
jgi:hypothetical protein